MSKVTHEISYDRALEELKFTNLLKPITKVIDDLPDTRCSGKLKYSHKDVFLSILAMTFFQSKSMLEFQRSLETKFGTNNLKTLFGVIKTPSDRQIKDVADNISYESFSKIFVSFFRALEKANYVENYEFIYGHHLMPIDGSQYFSSQKVSCPQCLSKECKDGTHYSHQILQSAIVKPGVKEIIPMFPEAIQNSDGEEKQDCEINAAKRLLKKTRQNHLALKLIIVGDGLYSKQPFIEEVKSQRMSYILVAKETDHPTLYENIANLDLREEVKEIETIDERNRVSHISLL